ncbi:hypothetical protein CgunFtcFv8_002558 [Champsocephalus gunnari]|uniref:Putative monooxygenase p33MONOX n=1 Tax=Champsocephalus gunnari TaxID=52237 RepID=A0AAN8HMT4_CHAGU|nr:hypothetical protein CgunFtcFv8_002558 [Champsocephalus gunnari]
MERKVRWRSSSVEGKSEKSEEALRSSARSYCCGGREEDQLTGSHCCTVNMDTCIIRHCRVADAPVFSLKNHFLLILSRLILFLVTGIMSGSRDIPAIEGPGMGAMRLPIGMTRRALSYDDNLEAPMSTPPHDISINNLWRRPIIPERKFSRLAEEDEGAAVRQSSVAYSAPSRSPTVVKTKASSIMNSLITKQTQESVYRFEQRAGLTDTSYTPHKGLTAEETRHHHRMPESLQKLQIQSMEAREERQSASAQSTPSNTPQTSPKQQRRGWFGSTSSDVSSSNSSVDLVDSGVGAAAGGGGGGGGGAGGGGAGGRSRNG